MKNLTNIFRTFITSLSVIIVLSAIGVGIYFYVSSSDSNSAERSIDELNEFSFDTEEITTDLRDGRYVRVQFKIITDGKKAVTEVEKRDFQIKNILIKEISEMNKQDFTNNLDHIEVTLQQSLNEVMTEGTITDVYTIRKILQ